MKEDQGKTSIFSKKQMPFRACRADHDVLLYEKASCEQKCRHHSTSVTPFISVSLYVSVRQSVYTCGVGKVKKA